MNTNKIDLNIHGKIDNNYTIENAITVGTVHTRELIENTDFFIQWDKIDFSPIIGQTLYSRKKLSGEGINDKIVFYAIDVDSMVETPHALTQQVNIIRRRIDGDKAHTYQQGEIINVKLSKLFPEFEGRTASAGVKKTNVQKFIESAKTYKWTAPMIQALMTPEMSDDDKAEIESYIETLTS